MDDLKQVIGQAATDALPAVPSPEERLAGWFHGGLSEARDRLRARFGRWMTHRQLENEVKYLLRHYAAKMTMGHEEFLRKALRQPALMATAVSPSMALVPENIIQSQSWTQFSLGPAGTGVDIDEVLRWPLWHLRDYSAAGSTLHTFFGESDGTATYGENGSNMATPGQLPAYEYFVVMSHKYAILQALTDQENTTATSVHAPAELFRALFTPSHVVFRVGKKDYLNIGPAGSLPTGYGINLGSFLAGNTHMVASNLGDPWKQVPPIGIPPVWTFSCKVYWNTVRAITTACFQVYVLDGIVIRAVH